ncbi:MAG: ParB/RepB/Spo0J family partition protein [Planctomycetota bacterium]|nr:ParB/RepB/Spo0J family partition protein [Planctomycetota bacterium]
MNPVNVSVRKLSDLKLNNEYLRTDTDVSALMKSVDSVGLIHPVTINADNELLAGARRFQAVSKLGWEEIPVQVVEQDQLVQELISIDENLVRTPLNQLELEKFLNRGREIYETINPTLKKVDISAGDLTTEEKKQQREDEEADEDSFAAVTAEKTGLSKSVIKGAIKRDALASVAVKRARQEGELNATKANEIIKLEKDTQEEVLPLLANKTAKETRRIVAAAKTGGLTAARAECDKVVPMPREYSQMIAPIKRVNKSIGRILAEELKYEGPEQGKINNELVQLRNQLTLYFQMMGVES